MAAVVLREPAVSGWFRSRGTTCRCCARAAGQVRAKLPQSAPRHDAAMPRRNGQGIALLADETRRRIVALLAERPMRPSAVARELGLSRPAISRQLALLQEARLVRRHV